jgi:hypothetical protein
VPSPKGCVLTQQLNGPARRTASHDFSSPGKENPIMKTKLVSTLLFVCLLGGMIEDVGQVGDLAGPPTANAIKANIGCN